MEDFGLIILVLIVAVGLVTVVFRKKEKSPVIVDNSGVPPYVETQTVQSEDQEVSIDADVSDTDKPVRKSRTKKSTT